MPVIEITRRQARTIRSLIRRALGLSPKYGEHPVRITTDDKVGTIRSQRHGVAVEYRFDADSPAESIVVPLSILADCEAARDDPVTFSKQSDDTVLVEWHDKGVPILRTAHQTKYDDEFPAPPETWHQMLDEFLPALADAMATTDREATRYSIDCVQLCGKTGRILATDSRKALVVTGFHFPWDDEVLLPWNGVLSLKELSEHGPVCVGRNDKTLSLTTGPWTLHFALETERRFPRIDDCIPKPGSEKTTLMITDEDAEFATTAIKSFPKLDLDNTVFVDLNGNVAMRARANGPATELVLSNSVPAGKATCFVSDRDILRHALQLGFREFRVDSPEKVIASDDGNRTFIWMPLAPPEPVKIGPDTVRLRSPVIDAAAQSPTNPTRRTTTTMAKNRISQNGHAEANGHRDNNAPNGIDLLIEQSENLKASLKETQTAVNDLISGLKQHRQQTKKLRSAVLSIKELQAIES